MAYVDYKCLESLLIEGEDLSISIESNNGDLLKLSEDKYNKYFQNIKTECVCIIKNILKTNHDSKAKFVIGTHKIGNFTPRFVGYNEIYIGYFQYVTSEEIKPIVDEFMSIVNDKYSTYVSTKRIYFECKHGISLYLNYKKYDDTNDKIVPQLSQSINSCIEDINKDLKLPPYLSTKKNTYTIILSRLQHMLTVLNDLDDNTVTYLKNDIAAINKVYNVSNNKIKSSLTKITNMVSQLK